ncbi:8-oxoguanine DNA glycosylase, partial [Vibrio parahaemolyticus]|nr:8-oxoguanine DNA glycosylase [Vibrio parahaemolyticus]
MLYYDIKEIKGNLIIEGLRDFNPKHIFECGQSFRWKKEDDSSYTAIANKRLIN